jgi:hypothetical protein
LKKEFFCSISGLSYVQGMKGGDKVDLAQLLAESFREVGHLFERMGTFLIEPSQNLGAPVSFFSE